MKFGEKLWKLSFFSGTAPELNNFYNCALASKITVLWKSSWRLALFSGDCRISSISFLAFTLSRHDFC